MFRNTTSLFWKTKRYLEPDRWSGQKLILDIILFDYLNFRIGALSLLTCLRHSLVYVEEGANVCNVCETWNLIEKIPMSSILFSLPELYASYKNWLSQNPQIASDYETTAKWISYFVAGKWHFINITSIIVVIPCTNNTFIGRINNSHVVSELIYALSNLLVLFNDRIINQARQIELPTSGDRLKLWLTVVEYCEVFFELSAQKVWGNAGKWLIVVAVQVFKWVIIIFVRLHLENDCFRCISRFILLYHHNEPIIPHPPIPTLERRVLVSPESSTDPSFGDVTQAHLDSVSFTLKRSGKVVRKVDSSPPITARSWKSLERSSQCDNEQTIEQTLAGTQLIAESIYIAKPIVHLASMAAFGSHTWKPWVISLLMELSR